MTCPYCDAQTRALETRGEYRDRECRHCGQRFTTREVVLTNTQKCARTLAARARAQKERNPWHPAISPNSSRPSSKAAA
jgi:transcriptional regulator NrdR family protein